MSTIPSREEALFTDALAQPPAERGPFLAKACGEDFEMLGRLVALIKAHTGPESLMASSAASPLLRASATPEERPGDVIGRYKLLEKLGEGGCGAVWAAEQREPVKRRVALKIIKLGMDTRQVIARFEAERQALAMMDHPNIAKMLDAGATETGRPYFVMELVRGIPITAYCDENHLTTTQRMQLAIKVCHAIQHAHQKGIIHRDIKPSNVLITLHDGEPVPKVIDFGIAKATQQELTEKTIYTKFQQFIGTPAYMSPEQAEMSGLDIDTRSDIYSLGVLVYELVTGRTPFDSKDLLKQGVDEIRRTIREKEPPRPSTRIETMQGEELTTAARRRSTDPRKLAASVRGDLDWVVMKCLEKDRTRRYETANGLAMDVQRFLAHEPVVARPPSTAYRVRKFVRRHSIGVTATAAIVGVVVVGSIIAAAQARRALRAERAQNELREAARRAETVAAAARLTAEQEQQRNAKIRWARETALPEINRLVAKADLARAYEMAVQVEKYLPTDPALVNLWPALLAKATFEINPPGADIYYKEYARPESEWRYLGKGPAKDVRMAPVLYRWQFRQEGHAVAERAYTIGKNIPIRLLGASAAPPEMVPVWSEEIYKSTSTAGVGSGTGLPFVALGNFLIDRHEVSNREYKEFVDRGGYRNRSYWKQPFRKDGRELPWEEAIAMFRDSTGQPGPSTWVNGSYPMGKDHHPVTGVSWFEAAAFAEFVGKRLPSIYHWRLAAWMAWTGSIVPFSNFSGKGLAPCGQYHGMSQYGVYDLAGNAKEWCWNESKSGNRYILGGGWSEPEYMFLDRDKQSPFNRGELYGFRCMKLFPDAPALATQVDAPYSRPPSRNYANERPVSDEEFQTVRKLYAYDKTPLEERLEHNGESAEGYRFERVSLDAAYHRERFSVMIWLPKKSAPPFQAVIYFPGAGALQRRKSEEVNLWDDTRLVIEHGRAIVFPVYKGTYERGGAGWKYPPTASVAYRDWTVQLYQDLARTIDYLGMRRDISSDKLAYLGYSWGARLGALLPAVEPRLRASVLLCGGFPSYRYLPEADPINFAPRVTVPTLMVNGRHDYAFPLETIQKPMFELLGTPPEDKRHLVLESGHAPPLDQCGRDIIAWFDKYLGPVK